MNTFRMLVVDLDGTALQGHDRLRQDDVEAAARLKQAGIAVTIATGRLVGGTSWVADQLGVVGGFAVMNGSARFDVTGEQLHHEPLAGGALQQIGAILSDAELHGFHFLSHEVLHGVGQERHAEYLGIWTPNVRAMALHDSESWRRDDVLAVGAVGSATSRHAVEAAQSALTANEALEVVGFDTFGGEPFLSIRLRRDDKGTALDALAAERGLDRSQVVAVGDWWNDVPMLRVAGCSFAMAEAAGGALEAADHQLQAKRGEGGAIAEIAARVWGL